MLRRDQGCSADVPCAVKFHPDWGDPATPADASPAPVGATSVFHCGKCCLPKGSVIPGLHYH